MTHFTTTCPKIIVALLTELNYVSQINIIIILVAYFCLAETPDSTDLPVSKKLLSEFRGKQLQFLSRCSLMNSSLLFLQLIHAVEFIKVSD